MNKIADIVREIISLDLVNKEALRLGTLNLSAYSELILQKVEMQAKKQVKKNSIIAALSRYKETLVEVEEEVPLFLEGINLKSGLAAVTFEKNANLLGSLGIVSTIQREKESFYVVAEGLKEITFVGENEYIGRIVLALGVLPKKRFNNATAITLNFDLKYVEIPNILYRLVSSLSLRKVNLLQVVSNLTEVSFLIEDQYVNDALDAFRGYLR